MASIHLVYRAWGKGEGPEGGEHLQGKSEWATGPSSEDDLSSTRLSWRRLTWGRECSLRPPADIRSTSGRNGPGPVGALPGGPQTHRWTLGSVKLGDASECCRGGKHPFGFCAFSPSPALWRKGEKVQFLNGPFSYCRLPPAC